MSWTAYAASVDIDGIATIEVPYPIDDDPREQFEKAKQLAIDLVESGVVGGSPDHRFNVSLSGHANPGHEPTEGWSNDAVTISISQATPPSTE